MRSLIIVSALLASVAVAIPAQEKRDVVTNLHTEYVTEFVTVQASPPSPSPEPVEYVHRQHRQFRHRTQTTIVIVTASPEPVPSPEQQAPEPVPTLSPEPIPAPVQEPEQQAPAPPSSSPEPSKSPQTSEEAVVPTPAALSAARPNSDSTFSGNSYQQACLDHHNQHRSNHSAQALQWDAGLEASARIAAETCVFAHQMKINGGGYGQNLAARFPGGPNEIAKVITDQFYNNEMELYPGYGSEPDMSNMHAWGHFSQVVWAETTHVACVTVDCRSRTLKDPLPGHLTVCNYSPPGNFGGRYGRNVLPPKGAPIISG